MRQTFPVAKAKIPMFSSDVLLMVHGDGIKFFTICTQLVEMALLASKDLTTAKKVTSSGA